MDRAWECSLRGRRKAKRIVVWSTRKEEKWKRKKDEGPGLWAADGARNISCASPGLSSLFVVFWLFEYQMSIHTLLFF